MSESDNLNGLGLAFLGSCLVKQEAARQRLNRKLLALHDQLVVELEKATKRTAILRRREEALTMARDGLLAMETMGIMLPEPPARELLVELDEEGK